MSAPQPPPRRPARRWLPVVVILAVITLILAYGSAMDPRLNYPVISQTVCSLRGDTWYGGGLLGEPGCYAP